MRRNLIDVGNSKFGYLPKRTLLFIFLVLLFVALSVNRPFAQLLPGLETGHPVTVGQSPTCSFSVSDGREVLFLSPFRAVLGAIHVQVIDRLSPDAPSLTRLIIVQMVYSNETLLLSTSFVLLE